MKLTIILQSNTPERVWNTFRFAITALGRGHTVDVFLMSEGSELESIGDTEHFDLSVKVQEFLAQGGVLHACGTCLRLRDKEGTTTCPVSTMANLVELVEHADRVLVF